MRTTLTIDDDVLAAAKAMAEHEGKTIGEVLSRMARKSLTEVESVETRNGIPLLPRRSGSVVTTEMVKALLDEFP